MVGAEGVGEVQEKDEQDIDGIQIDCIVMDEFQSGLILIVSNGFA